ncbi:hypothetical protein [Aeromonas veronii]|uniref:hypothetical protein n=1 Tax=Aeromonas TaxID=642 RepID=UPI00225023D8|nr:hypothetical protein [Aeromonas veronii]MCX4046819.1 hypothetical protein [Aeromonas veronii]HDN9007913.1 hypothetical protein [Aeromonas veronii]
MQQLIVAADPPPRQLGSGAEGNQRPHYSADWQSGIAPNNPLLSGKPTTLFPTTPTNPNKIKGHGNPASAHTLLLSQRKKSVITDTYVIF